jgi:predicted NACHT family NTPase
LKENISQVGKVKTILNPDTIVDLRNIFFEKAISFEEVDKIKLTSFFKHKQVLIEGGPGQGKSFFLRYLCLNEGESSRHIPIFIEFRNLKFSKSLKEELFEAIRDFGVDIDNDLFDFLAKSEKVLFILDEFDEIPNTVRSKVAKELETIARTYPELRIVVSSRPNSGMGASVYFGKYKINPLSVEYQLEFVEYLYSGGNIYPKNSKIVNSKMN